jgi:hypothetical protein
VQRHLGPAPGWFVKDKVVGRFPLHLGSTLHSVDLVDGKVAIRFADQDGNDQTLLADHVISATGFRVCLSKFTFLDDALRSQIAKIEDAPVLSSNFECSVPGLYMVGLVSANSFGPLTRFAFGAGFTSKRLTQHLVRLLQPARRPAPIASSAPSSAQ